MDWHALVLLVGWALSGAFAWWVAIRYIQKELGVSDLIVLPMMMAIGLVGIFVVFCAFVSLNSDEPIKSWKDKK